MVTAALYDFKDNVLSGDDLVRHPARVPNYEKENDILCLLAEEMSSRPETILQKIVEFSLELCGADASGISIFEPGRDFFRWHAVAGSLAAHNGEIFPRKSVCGAVTDRKAALLFRNAAQYFAELKNIHPYIHEILLLPWCINEEMMGTLWIVSHKPEPCFDAEDVRILNNLTRFVAASYQMVLAIQKAKSDQKKLEEHKEITTKKLLRIGEQLSETEEQFKRALNIGTVGVLLFDLDEWIGDANEAFQRMSGYSHEELLKGVHWETLTPPEFRAATQRATGQLAETGETEPYEKQLVRPDGTRWWGLFAPRRIAGSGQES